MYIKEEKQETEENGPVKIELLNLEDIKTEEFTDEFLRGNDSNPFTSKPIYKPVKLEPIKRTKLKVRSRSCNCIPPKLLFQNCYFLHMHSSYTDFS